MSVFASLMIFVTHTRPPLIRPSLNLILLSLFIFHSVSHLCHCPRARTQDDDLLFERAALQSKIDALVAEPTLISDYKSEADVEAESKAAAAAAAAAQAQADEAAAKQKAEEESKAKAKAEQAAATTDVASAAAAAALTAADPSADSSDALSASASDASASSSSSTAAAAAAALPPRTSEHWEVSEWAHTWPRRADGTVAIERLDADGQRRYFLAVNAKFRLPGRESEPTKVRTGFTLFLSPSVYHCSLL
jgi:hypothetical protein